MTKCVTNHRECGKCVLYAHVDTPKVAEILFLFFLLNHPPYMHSMRTKLRSFKNKFLNSNINILSSSTYVTLPRIWEFRLWRDFSRCFLADRRHQRKWSVMMYATTENHPAEAGRREQRHLNISHGIASLTEGFRILLYVYYIFNNGKKEKRKQRKKTKAKLFVEIRVNNEMSTK